MRNRSLRRISAIVSFFSFIALSLSGLVMLFWPGHGGRGGGGVETYVLGLDRHAWNTGHEVVAIVFLVAALVHLALNWPSLKRHLGFGQPAAVPAGRDYL